MAVFQLTAQDTLVYKDGRIAIGHVVDMDTAASKLAFRGDDGYVRVILMRSLTQIKQDSQPHVNSDYFESKAIAFVPYQTATVRDPSVLRIPSRYTYGNLMVGINLASFIPRTDDNTPANSTLALEAEYFFTDLFSINVEPRFGIEYRNIDTDTISFSLGGGNEIIYQIGITPKIYPFKQGKFAWYLGPVFRWGSAYYIRRVWVDDFAIWPETGLREQYIDTKFVHSKARHSYNEIGLTLGMLFNVTRTINFGAQFSTFSTENSRHGDEYYSNWMQADGTQELQWADEYSYEEWQARFHLQVFYRFGGKLTE